MNLVEKWKIRETKKKLRDLNDTDKKIYVDSKNIQKLGVKVLMKKECPNEVMKQNLFRKLCLESNLIDFVEYDFCDSQEYEGLMFCTLTLYVAKGDNRKCGSIETM